MSTRNAIEQSFYGLSDAEVEMHQSIKKIEQYLLKELSQKQRTIEEEKSEASMLHFLLEEKNQMIQGLQTTIAECRQNVEGNRQLINKLLNEQARMQQDLEWYKRTYETRTLLGLIKDRVKYFFSK